MFKTVTRLSSVFVPKSENDSPSIAHGRPSISCTCVSRTDSISIAGHVLRVTGTPVTQNV